MWRTGFSHMNLSVCCIFPSKVLFHIPLHADVQLLRIQGFSPEKRQDYEIPIFRKSQLLPPFRRAAKPYLFFPLAVPWFLSTAFNFYLCSHFCFCLRNQMNGFLLLLFLTYCYDQHKGPTAGCLEHTGVWQGWKKFYRKGRDATTQFLWRFTHFYL